MQHLIKIFSIILFPFLFGVLIQGIRPADPSLEAVMMNPEHLDGPFTGGFGEQTCHSCHFDYDLNMEGGSLDLGGFPKSFKAGEEYPVTVRISSEQLELGGFQITARFRESGNQAGSFSWEGDRLMFTPESAVGEDILYLQHSSEGTSPTSEKTVEWSFTWTAPENAEGPVQFNIASNAGNYDDSSFGDWIYVKELTSHPAE
jgi:hypothetical protein